MKRALIKLANGQETELELHESRKKGMNWHLKKGHDGFHWKSLESAKKNLAKIFKRAGKEAEVTIVS